MEKSSQHQQQQESGQVIAQRNPRRMINLRRGNTEVRDGKCYILFRSELDPRWPHPQFIDESVVDRNRLESLNLQHLNLDVGRRTRVKCVCTRLISLRDDWHVQIHDGTIICAACARCARCFKLCFTAGRKLTSIDGFALCNTCILSYGAYRDQRLRFRVEPLPQTLGDMETVANAAVATGQQQQKQPPGAPAAAPGTDANDAYHPRRRRLSCLCKQDSDSDAESDAAGGETKGDNSNKANNNDEQQHQQQQQLEKPRFRDEGRRPLRLILYPDSRPENYGRPTYQLEPPPYLSVDTGVAPACPECSQQAKTQAMVVPGLARVYREKSLKCANCKRQLSAGYQVPGAQFQGCSCVQQSKTFCSGPQCEAARQAHHAETGCHLEPVHPGGRPKRDVPGFAPQFDPVVEGRRWREQVELEEQKREQLRQLKLMKQQQEQEKYQKKQEQKQQK